MAKQPTLPKHLSKKTAAWARSVLAEYALSASQFELLCMAGEQRDQSEAARAAVAREGAVVQDRFGISKENPWAKLQRDSAMSCSRLLRELGLAVDESDEARPPRIGGRG